MFFPLLEITAQLSSLVIAFRQTELYSSLANTDKSEQ